MIKKVKFSELWRFPKTIGTLNGETLAINPNNINERRFEMIQQRKLENDILGLKFLTFPTNFEYDEFIELAEENRIDYIFDARGDYFYKYFQ